MFGISLELDFTSKSSTADWRHSFNKNVFPIKIETVVHVDDSVKSFHGGQHSQILSYILSLMNVVRKNHSEIVTRL